MNLICKTHLPLYVDFELGVLFEEVGVDWNRCAHPELQLGHLGVLQHVWLAD